jgi:hypothetical protein
MNSHVLAVSTRLFASPLAEGERIEVRGSTMKIRLKILTLPFPLRGERQMSP